MAPVREFRMNNRSSLPDKVDAFTVSIISFFELRISTLDPPVKYKPASNIHLFPKGIPNPELAPNKQSSPTEILTSFPPDKVPIVEQPPPKSEFFPITTPAEILPSIIAEPSVPALKLTKPSCITVVPSDKWAPNLTLELSAILTPSGIM